MHGEEREAGGEGGPHTRVMCRGPKDPCHSSLSRPPSMVFLGGRGGVVVAARAKTIREPPSCREICKWA